MTYPSLDNQLCIGGVYVRLLLEGGDASEWARHRGRAQAPSAVPDRTCSCRRTASMMSQGPVYTGAV